MPSHCMHASFQSLSPFIDSGVNDGLLQTMPDVNKATLQFIDIVHTTLVHAFLHVVDRVVIYKSVKHRHSLAFNILTWQHRKKNQPIPHFQASIVSQGKIVA